MEKFNIINIQDHYKWSDEVSHDAVLVEFRDRENHALGFKLFNNKSDATKFCTGSVTKFATKSHIYSLREWYDKYFDRKDDLVCVDEIDNWEQLMFLHLNGVIKQIDNIKEK